jgi:hypothetical protein
MKLYDISDWCKHGLEVTDYPYIGEVDISVDNYVFGTPIMAGETCYAVSALSKTENAAGVRKMEINEEPDDQCLTNQIKCPYCGYENRDSWECADSNDEYERGRCQGVFSYERVVTVEYNSYPVKPPETIRGIWIEEAATV